MVKNGSKSREEDVLGDARAVVADLDPDPLGVRLAGGLDADCHLAPAPVGEDRLVGVGQEVEDHLDQPAGVDDDRRQVVGDVDLDRQRLAAWVHPPGEEIHGLRG